MSDVLIILKVIHRDIGTSFNQLKQLEVVFRKMTISNRSPPPRDVSFSYGLPRNGLAQCQAQHPSSGMILKTSIGFFCKENLQTSQLHPIQSLSISLLQHTLVPLPTSITYHHSKWRSVHKCMDALYSYLPPSNILSHGIEEYD